MPPVKYSAASVFVVSEIMREITFYHKRADDCTILLNLETVTFASSSGPHTTSDSLCMICVIEL